VNADQPGPNVCQVCDSVLPARPGRGRDRQYCSRACQQTAYRARRTPQTDPQARLDDLRSAVDNCWAPLQRGDMTCLAAAADTAARTARVLAHAARQSITPEQVTPSHQRQTTPPEHETGPPSTGNRSITPVPVTQTPLHPEAGTQAPPPPRRPVLDLGDGYELQPPPDLGSTRWSLFHRGQHIGHVERTSTWTGRSPRWRAHSPTGRPITAATTAAADGTYRTKRDAMVQVALEHKLLTERRRRNTPGHGR
jgi:hypothetical protein